MKTFAYLLIIFVAFSLYSCKKESLATGLTGKWVLSATLSETASGNSAWVPVAQTSSTDYVTFNTNGRLEGTAFSTYVSYVVKDSITLTFNTKNGVLQNYRYGIKNDTITMSPAGPIFCIEGCGTRFTKVK